MHPIQCRWLPLGLLSFALSLACLGLSPDEPASIKEATPSIDEATPSHSPADAEHFEQTSYGGSYELYHGEGNLGSVYPTHATASSTLEAGKNRHAAMRASDQDLATAWCEGSDGLGEGDSLTLSWDQPVVVYAVQVWGGYFKDEARLFSNGRLKSYGLKLDSGETWNIQSAEAPRDNFKNNKDSPNGFIFPDLSMMPGHEVTMSTSLTIEITAVSPGDEYQDTCISEVKIWTQPTCDDCGD